MSIGEGASGYQVLEGMFTSVACLHRAVANISTELGSGSFGTVFKGICRATGDVVAIKLVSLAQSTLSLFTDGRRLISNPARTTSKKFNKRYRF